MKLLKIFAKVLILALSCGVVVATITSCSGDRLILYDNSGGFNPGELLATIYIEENGQRRIYEIFENRFINFPVEDEALTTDDIPIIAVGTEISRSEMREIRRLLNRVLAKEQGNLGLIDSAIHVTITQGEKEIRFTHGMADICQSDELVSRLLETWPLIGF